jgi:hypothetical protein
MAKDSTIWPACFWHPLCITTGTIWTTCTPPDCTITGAKLAVCSFYLWWACQGNIVAWASLHPYIFLNSTCKGVSTQAAKRNTHGNLSLKCLVWNHVLICNSWILLIGNDSTLTYMIDIRRKVNLNETIPISYVMLHFADITQVWNTWAGTLSTFAEAHWGSGGKFLAGGFGSCRNYDQPSHWNGGNVCLTPDGLLDLWLTTPLPCQHPLRNKFEMLQW